MQPDLVHTTVSSGSLKCGNFLTEELAASIEGLFSAFGYQIDEFSLNLITAEFLSRHN
jgi:hypothetical protein